MTELVAGALLVVVIVEDLRRYRIRNAYVFLLALGFLVASYEHDRLDLILPHALFALVGLAALFGAFAAGLIGGGDAKLLACALLWIGPEGLFVFSLALLACVLAYLAATRAGLAPARRRDGRTEIPFGPSIAAAWIAVLILSAYLRARPG